MLFALTFLLACEKDELLEDSAPTELSEDCTDGVDNDEDGLSDCADSDCEASCIEECDGLDGDQDGLIDCADPDCEASCIEECDGLDGDQDGLIDCADPDCAASCIEECDGLDGDQDGLVDCEDPDCFSSACAEDCFDGLDNDADGLLDCEDGDCAAACVESACADGLDNDGDSLIDCLDDDCIASESCLSEKEVWINSAHMYRASTLKDIQTTYSYTSFTSMATLTGVEGVIRQAAGSGALSTTSSILSCDFQIDTWNIEMSREDEWGVQRQWVSLNGLDVSGVRVSAPCEGLPSSQFLPDYERPGLAEDQIRWGLWGKQLGYLYEGSGETSVLFEGNDWLTGSELISAQINHTSQGGPIVHKVYSGDVVGVAAFIWEPPLDP